MKSLERQLKNLLRQIDFFSIPVPVLTNDAKSQFSSPYSGLISVFASILSLAYFAYVISEWANGNIPPTITSNQQAQAYSEQDLEDNFIQFKLSDPTNHDPFKRQNNIITPLLFTVENFKIVSAPMPLFSDENKPFTVGLQQGTLVVNNLKNQIDGQSFKPQKNYLLIFIECLDQYLDDNSNCASQEEIDQYMSEYHGFLSIVMQLEQYDYRQNQIEYITKQAYQALSPAYIQYTQITIQQKEINLDNGLLFENKISHKLINDFYIINQSIDNQYIQNIASSFSTQKFQLKAIFTYQISIDNLQISERIIQPKLSAVLAYIGSIVQVIFLLKYVAYFINNQQFKEEMQTEILQMQSAPKQNRHFYCCRKLNEDKITQIFKQKNQLLINQLFIINIKLIDYLILINLQIYLFHLSLLNKIFYSIVILSKIERNIFGKITSTNQSDDNQNEHFIKQYEGHLHLAFKKLRLINIIYEISRLELLMEKHFGLQNICECSQLGAEFWYGSHDKKNESPKTSMLSVGNQSPQPMDDIFRLFNKS